MRLHFFAIFLAIVVVFCGPPQMRDADITITYESKVIHETQSGWNTEYDLRKASEDKKKEYYIIFSASWCTSCKTLMNIINKMDWRNKVLLLNSEHVWVQSLASETNLEGIPQMLVVGPNRSEKNNKFVGASQISWELYELFERKKRKNEY
jgi:thiol-disulfide isomerase/thioredoxin